MPIGVARDLGVPMERLVRLPGISRPIAAVARKSTFENPAVRALLAELSAAWPSFVTPSR